MATHATDARQTESTLVSLIGTASPRDLALESLETLADLQERVGRDLGGFNRSLLLGVMAAGALLTAIVVFADVLVRRKDIGRRRALGASRTIIIVLVLLRTAYPAVLGAVLETVLGWSPQPS